MHELPWRQTDFGAAVEARRQRRRMTEGLRERLTWAGFLLVLGLLALSAWGT